MRTEKIAYFVLAFAAVGLLTLILQGPARVLPRASGGVLDLREWDLAEQGPVALEGEWFFRRQEFMDPDLPPESYSTEADKSITAPAVWNKFGLTEGEGNPGFGYGTYRLKVLLRNQGLDLGFRFLDQSSAHRVFVNGVQIFASGYPGTSRESSVPSHRTGIASYTTDSTTIDITLWISNYHHWQGGLWEPILLGSHDRIARDWETDLFVAVLLFGALLLIGVYHLAVYLMFRKDKAPLWFGLFCLLISSRLLTTGVRPIYVFLSEPNWDSLLRSIYIDLYLAIPVFIAYLRSLFPEDVNRKFLAAQAIVSAGFVLTALVLPSWLYTRGMPLFQAVMIVAMIYGLFIIARARARGRENSSLVLLSFILFSAAAIHDILCSRDLIESVYILHYGVLIFVFVQAVILARRFRMAFVTVESQRKELVEANETIRESESRITGLLRTITDVVWFSDIQGRRIEYVNPAAESLYGQPVAGLMEDSGFWLKAAHPRDREAVAALTGQVLERDRVQLDYRIIDPRAGERWVLDRRFLVRDEEGKPVRIGCIVTDMTARRSAEEERRSLEDQLRQSQKMEALGTLAGGIAHDFNNILGAILGFGELAQVEMSQGDRGSAHLERIIEAADRGRKVVQKILTFSRKSPTTRKPQDLNLLVTSGVRVLRHTIPKNIEIRMELAGNLDSVLADATQIDQVLMNLTNNARDAMPEGGYLVFRTALVEIDPREAPNLGLEPGRYVLLSVADTGQGMDKDQVSQAFDPFFTTKEIGRGTGLGLSIVYGIVKEHGGRISCQSQPGRGTTFSIYLPVLDPAANGEPEHSEEALPQGPEPGPASPLGGPESLLVVDDEEPLREMAAEILAGVGYRVVTAASGEEALEIYARESQKPDLVLLDLGMPGMGGRVCLEKLVGLDPGVRVLIASGYSAESDLGDLRLAKGFMAKPYRRKVLLERVREILDLDPSAAPKDPSLPGSGAGEPDQ